MFLLSLALVLPVFLSSPAVIPGTRSTSMRSSRLAKPSWRIAGLLIGLLFAILVVPFNAQPVGSYPYYDISKEVTLSGTVSSVLVRPERGMIWGSHFLLSTVSGTVDASLGRWGLQGNGALSVSPGQQVEVTGIMKTFNNREVFLVRSAKAGGKVYTLRNVHGIEVSPQTRERAAQKGKSL
jgi:hypothetical protein